uniref:laccase n=1 Tax=Fagus sylvatica TaxID=28930 RepID=A0A2N9F9U7_FAGSY
MLTVNGGFPGPTLHVYKGDRAYVNVHNEGTYGVIIHWHGVNQPRNPWSDGPENITQCPIKPGKNFTYEVIFSAEEGTLWWHAHSDWTRATVHGAIIILPDKGSTYPFPKPDAQDGDVKQIIDNATATGADPTLSDAYTINGQPGFPNNCSNESSYKLPVEYGKTYLLRVINAVMNEEMFFGIAKHNLTVVAQDGAYIKPITTSYIMITPGQTMDILLTANQTSSYYYIAATPFVDSNAPFDSTNTSAILPILCSNASCGGPDGNRLSASLNNISFVTPSIDILQAYYRYRSLPGVFGNDFPSQPPYVFNYTGDVGNNTLYPSLGTKARLINYGEAVEIVFQGTNVGNAENHPIHLHGYSFYLVGTGYGNFSNTSSPSTYNVNDPPEVNTIGVPKNGWATIRFLANNPGVCISVYALSFGKTRYLGYGHCPHCEEWNHRGNKFAATSS